MTDFYVEDEIKSFETMLLEESENENDWTSTSWNRR
jgi:hypothetical protein